MRQIYDYGHQKHAKNELMEIVNFEESLAGSFELATFDIDLGAKWGIVLRRFKLCKSKSGHHYFQSSSYKKGESDGKPNWMSYIHFYGDKGKDFSTAVMELLKPFLDEPAVAF